MSKMTEGPWELHIGELDGVPTGCVQGPKGSNSFAPVCMVIGPDAKANGEAIAALRDLIEAAEQVVMEWVESEELDEAHFSELVSALRSALSKAGVE